jgi:hypothetical protein
MTEEEVGRSGRKALVARMQMEDVGRAYERSETKGFMKIIVDAETGQLIGAALLGIEGDEIVQGLLDMMYAKAPYTVIRRAMHIHPTHEMILWISNQRRGTAGRTGARTACNTPNDPRSRSYGDGISVALAGLEDFAGGGSIRPSDPPEDATTESRPQLCGLTARNPP